MTILSLPFDQIISINVDCTHERVKIAWKCTNTPFPLLGEEELFLVSYYTSIDSALVTLQRWTADMAYQIYLLVHYWF